MDTSRLNQGQMIVGIGGIVLVISLFLSWVSAFGASESAFGAFSAMDIIMLVIGLAAVAYAASVATNSAVAMPVNPALLLSALGLIVVGWALGWDLESGYAGIGAWLGLLAGAAIAYGGFVSGGRAGTAGV